MASSSAILSLSVGGVHFGTCSLQSNKLKPLSGHQSQLSMRQSSKYQLQKLSVRAEYGDGSRGGGGDFLAGVIIGGALFGTLAYVFAPQIRRSLLNEDESGFRRAKRPIYYHDDGLEKTRQTLNAKISQLNSAIDNVSTRLRGGKNTPATELIETEPEVEATL
ncbi:hypothetical protein M5K25_023747 [Dendrobium thyrsiflorum]|uniref:Low-density receptor-like protein n=1 Tax=Dendrobium thyrsiflorum TaxID=117978 RepID=A0ABD0U0I5_DENTH